jgi:gliding motility-associated-like protein
MIVVKPNPSGSSYRVDVTGRCGLNATDSLNIQVEPVALLTNKPPASTICSGDNSAILLSSNISGAFFSWEPTLISGSATGFSPGTGATINQVVQLSSGFPGVVNYNIRVTGSGCDTSFTNFPLTVNPLPDVELGGPVFMDPGSGAELHAGGGFSSYLWSNGLSDSVIFVTVGGNYRVTVINEYGCLDSDTIMVTEFGLQMPNAITPNGDGLNDHFRIKGFEQTVAVLLQIFNRWGNLVFETNNLDKGWDGTEKDGSRQAGAYVWVIHFRSGDGHIFKGTVSVIL